MSHILSLISNPARPALSEDVVAAVVASLGRISGASPARNSVWLRDTIAWETEVTLNDAAAAPELLNTVRAVLSGQKIDANLLPTAGRRKQLLLADMDSTIIEQECLDELASFAGVGERVAAITERTMRGEINFESALKERVGLLKGLSADTLNRVMIEKITFTPGAASLARTMSHHGALTALVSGGFTYFTSRVADHCGFKLNFANQLVIENGALTGQVVEPILGREAKRATLVRLMADSRLDSAQSLAVGDGANDRDMLAEAGLGVAFHAKPILRAAAKAEINHGDLTALLYLQGYSFADFAPDEDGMKPQ